MLETGRALFFGDNLGVLREKIPDDYVDLVYLDPPFNKKQDYNVLFRHQDGTRAPAQIRAFKDTWRWDQESAAAYADLVEAGGSVSLAMQAFRRFLGDNDMLAYLSMMAPRLVELRRVLKPTGSIYLHCDPTASHYLKMLMDSIFEPGNLRNEIIWKRTTAKALTTRRLPSNHDVILVYQKSDDAYWNQDEAFIAYDRDNLDKKTASKYRHRDKDGRLYHLDNLLNPNKNRPNLEYEFLGVRRVWRWTRERMEKAYEDGRVIQPSPGAVPRMKRYLDEQRGRPIGDVWTDIPPLNSQAKEREGYPTQKPVALLRRIIEASCPADGIVLDPFCGCGTTIIAAEDRGRDWIGIDITHLATNLITRRLRETFPGISWETAGEPTTLEGARALAQMDRYQFEWWALSRVGAGERGGSRKKKGADKGIDGRLFFFERDGGSEKQIIFSVKSGIVHRSDVHELRGVVDREGAEIGVLVTLQDPTGPMREEAATGEFYESPFGRHPRIQILTIEEILDGHGVDCPPRAQVRVQRHKPPEKDPEQLEFTWLYSIPPDPDAETEDQEPRRVVGGAESTSR